LEGWERAGGRAEGGREGGREGRVRRKRSSMKGAVAQGETDMGD
jgi:hypothetical protein